MKLAHIFRHVIGLFSNISIGKYTNILGNYEPVKHKARIVGITQHLTRLKQQTTHPLKLTLIISSSCSGVVLFRRPLFARLEAKPSSPSSWYLVHHFDTVCRESPKDAAASLTVDPFFIKLINSPFLISLRNGGMSQKIMLDHSTEHSSVLTRPAPGLYCSACSFVALSPDPRLCQWRIQWCHFVYAKGVLRICSWHHTCMMCIPVWIRNQHDRFCLPTWLWPWFCPWCVRSPCVTHRPSLQLPSPWPAPTTSAVSV